MNATKKVLIVDGVYCIAKSLLVMFVVFAPGDVTYPILLPLFPPSCLVPLFVSSVWGVPLVLAVITVVLTWKATGLRWKGLLAAMIAWIGLVTVLETIYLGDFLFGWVSHMPT